MKYIFKNKFNTLLIGIIDFLGNIIILPFKIFIKIEKPAKVNNILLIRLDHIGDVISSTPIPENLKKYFPGAKISFLVANYTKEILMRNPYIDEIICYDAPWFSRDRKRVFEFRKFLKLAKILRRKKYDLGFDLRGDSRHILLMVLAGVKFRVGYAITGGGFLLHKKVNYRNNVHTIEHNLDLLRSINIEPIVREPKLYISTEYNHFIQNFFRENNFTDNDSVVLIHPFAGYSSKNWRKERFVKLIDALHNDYNKKIILIGSEKDKFGNDSIINMSRVPAINAAGKTSLGALLALIQKADIFIGVDSGPSHIASALNRPTVVLYSGTNRLDEWAPKGDRTSIIQKEIDCKGCEREECSDNKCMELISVADVLKAVKRLLEEKQRR